MKDFLINMLCWLLVMWFAATVILVSFAAIIGIAHILVYLEGAY